MSSESITFDDATELTFDSDEISVSGGQSQLKLQDDPGNVFTEDFADGGGHTYDNTKSEFSGGQNQQKLLIPSDAISGLTFDSTIDFASWSGGVVTGAAIGGALVSGGKLDLAHNDIRYVNYDAVSNADSQQVGAFKFKYTPNYSGFPSSDMTMITIKHSSTAANLILLRHSVTTGKFFILIYDSAQVAIVNYNTATTWSPTSGVEYEIELNWDLTTGATRLFIDGVQFGVTQTGTGTRSSDIGVLRIGTNLGGTDSSNFYIDDFVYFNAVQHTSNYTAGYTLYDYKYAATTDLLPEMEYTGVGTLIAATLFSTSYSGSPRIAIDIGRSGVYTYWNGSAWVAGIDDYTEASSPTDFAANIATLPVNGETYGQFKIYYDDSNTQSAFANLEITLTSQIYSILNPKVYKTDAINTQGIESLSITESGITAIEYNRHTAEVDGIEMYWNGSAWVASSGFSQSNTTSDYEDNITSLDMSEGVAFRPITYQHSESGTATPAISQIDIVYDFYAGEVTAPSRCTVYNTIYSEDEDDTPVENVKVSAYLSNPKAIYSGSNGSIKLLNIPIITKYTTAKGYWDMELIETTNISPETKWVFVFDYGGGKTVTYEKSVPNQESVDFEDLE